MTVTVYKAKGLRRLDLAVFFNNVPLTGARPLGEFASNGFPIEGGGISLELIGAPNGSGAKSGAACP